MVESILANDRGSSFIFFMCRLAGVEVSMKKNFIITVDTEGDNLWKAGGNITTNNAKFIPRFQSLCEKFGFKPVYLTDYEMAKDDYFLEFAKDALKRGACEIGMHMHPWNNPPFYRLNTHTDEKAYITEYPIDIADEKIKVITRCLEDSFNIDILSHRAGRWTTNREYFKLLRKHGYKIDCSVTPHISWRNNLGETGAKGSDYTCFREEPYYIYEGILEVPVTIRSVRMLDSENMKDLLKNGIFGKKLWMRPFSPDNKAMLALVDLVLRENKTDYLEFMIHSSELMPGGSPRFTSKDDIEALYDNLEPVFDKASKSYKGCILREYADFKVRFFKEK